MKALLLFLPALAFTLSVVGNTYDYDDYKCVWTITLSPATLDGVNPYGALFVAAADASLGYTMDDVALLLYGDSVATANQYTAATDDPPVILGGSMAASSYFAETSDEFVCNDQTSTVVKFKCIGDSSIFPIEDGVVWGEEYSDLSTATITAELTAASEVSYKAYCETGNNSSTLAWVSVLLASISFF